MFNRNLYFSDLKLACPNKKNFSRFYLHLIFTTFSVIIEDFQATF